MRHHVYYKSLSWLLLDVFSISFHVVSLPCVLLTADSLLHSLVSVCWSSAATKCCCRSLLTLDGEHCHSNNLAEAGDTMRFLILCNPRHTSVCHVAKRRNQQINNIVAIFFFIMYIEHFYQFSITTPFLLTDSNIICSVCSRTPLHNFNKFLFIKY